MSSPWVTPPAGSDLPPRNGNVQRYFSSQIFPRNTVTGSSWKPGREIVFQFESSPADGWIVPSESKIYTRFKVGTKHTPGVFPTAAKNAHSLRLKACPTYGLLDSAKYSMNGTTVQSVSGDLSKVAQFQLRLTGSRDSHDTNGSLGADSLRQTMLPPELLSSATSSAAKSVSEVFSPEVIPNDKQKILSDRIGNNGEIELMTPVSLGLTSWGSNKFWPGGSHDLRYTIGQYGVNMKRSVYTEQIEPRAIGQASVLGAVKAQTAADAAHATVENVVTLDGLAVDTNPNEAACTALKTSRGATDNVVNYNAATAGNQQLARARLLARCTPPVPAYDDTGGATAGDDELQIEMVECYLSLVMVLPVHGTVPRPLSTQFTYDNVHLITEPIGGTSTAGFIKNLTIPVNTTRLVLGFRRSADAISLNSELLGAEGGVKAAGGTPVSLSITLAGVSLPSPAYTLGFKGLANKKGEQTLRAWSDWGSFLKSSIANATGSQNLSEWQEDPLYAFRIMGDRSSVSQNLTVRAQFSDVVSAETDMLIWCIGTNVVEATYDDDASFQPTSVSVQEVV
eukprot:SAG25_NODE_946_length_4635_cov_4.212963_3_plen_566_part_00